MFDENVAPTRMGLFVCMPQATSSKLNRKARYIRCIRSASSSASSSPSSESSPLTTAEPSTGYRTVGAGRITVSKNSGIKQFSLTGDYFFSSLSCLNSLWMHRTKLLWLIKRASEAESMEKKENSRKPFESTYRAYHCGQY